MVFSKGTDQLIPMKTLICADNSLVAGIFGILFFLTMIHISNLQQSIPHALEPITLTSNTEDALSYF